MKPTRPEILAVQRDEDTVRLQLRIPANLHYFDGHFDALPLVPGVVQVDWAIHYARAHFALPGAFRRLSALKFTRVMTPDTETALALHWQASAGELRFRYGEDDAAYASGRVQFAMPCRLDPA